MTPTVSRSMSLRRLERGIVFYTAVALVSRGNLSCTDGVIHNCAVD